MVLTPWPGEPDPVEGSNREAIESLGEGAVRVLPWLALGDPQTWPPLEVPAAA